MNRIRGSGAARLTVLAAAALVLGGLLGGVVAGLGATPAAAHNALRSTSPTADALPQRTPGEIVLTFDEPAIAMGTQIVVTGPSGPVQSGAPRLVDTTVTQPLQRGAPAGRYRVEWRVTSADGHPVTGTFGFVSAEPGVGTPPDPSGSAVPVDPVGAPAAGSGTSGLPVVIAVVGLIVAAAIGSAVLIGVRRTRARSRSRYDRSASSAPAGADSGGDDRVGTGTDPPTETRPTPDE